MNDQTDGLVKNIKNGSTPKETKNIVDEIMNDQLCIDELEKTIKKLNVVNRKNNTNKFYLLQAALIYAKKVVEKNA